MKTTIIVLTAFIISAWPVQAEELSHEDIQTAHGVIDLHPCADDRLGIEMLCNRNWKQEVEPNAVMMVIDDDPAVLLTVARAEEPVTGIEELTDERIQALGQYADRGFTTEAIEINGDKAIRVEGFSAHYPELRLLDFYVIHDYTLYSFLFSVNPKSEWDNFEMLFEKIAQSIKIQGKP